MRSVKKCKEYLRISGLCAAAALAPVSGYAASSELSVIQLETSAQATAAGQKGLVAGTQAVGTVVHNQCSADTTVRTDKGAVCGFNENAVTYWLGIPFAASPVGQLRWQPPQPHAAWSDTLQATKAGPLCLERLYGTLIGSEDCLTLNVQAPDKAPRDQKLPVMVEIHGGGFVHTGGGSKLTGVADGTHLVNSGNVVYVAMNYRLGILGFMAHKELGKHSGNYGLMDQYAALHWVQENISKFGGDPNNVTIMGESTGGASVCAAFVSPKAKGLFHRGISESGYYNYVNNTLWPWGDCKSTLPSLEQAQVIGSRFATKVGCDKDNVVSCLRALPATKLTEEAGRMEAPLAGGTVGPIVDGSVLTMSPAQAFAEGKFAHVPIIIGIDVDEFNGGPLDRGFIATTADEYKQLIQQQYGQHTDEILNLYSVNHVPDPAPFIAHRKVMADSATVCPALRSFGEMAKYTKVYAFINGNTDTPNNSKWPAGAMHNAIARTFLFPPVGTTFNANQTVFQREVTTAYTGFARTGSPNVANVTPWHNLTASDPNVLFMQAAGVSVMMPVSELERQHNCGFWDNITDFSKINL